MDFAKASKNQMAECCKEFIYWVYKAETILDKRTWSPIRSFYTLEQPELQMNSDP